MIKFIQKGFRELPISIIYVILLLVSVKTYSQVVQNDTSSVQKKDTVCYKLKFVTGDTLVYRIISYDSISIESGTPLMRLREEKIRIYCDSVNDLGHFFLSQELIKYHGIENQGDEKNVERKTSSWIGRIVHYEVDSLGNRYSYTLDDSSKSALTPGGAFQPILIFPFQKSCKSINETWISASTDDLPENGIPTPLVKETLLCRAKNNIDTLNENCLSFEFIATAQGNMKVMTEEKPFQLTSVINGFGVMDISSTKFIPVHFYCTLEQKLTLHFADNSTKSGVHYINANFTLESLNHNVPKTKHKEKIIKHRKR